MSIGSLTPRRPHCDGGEDFAVGPGDRNRDRDRIVEAFAIVRADSASAHLGQVCFERGKLDAVRRGPTLWRLLAGSRRSTDAGEWSSRPVQHAASATCRAGWTLNTVRSPTLREKVLTRFPLARLATVDDVGRMALFLAGSEAAFVTGQTVAVDGGFLTT